MTEGTNASLGLLDNTQLEAFEQASLLGRERFDARSLVEAHPPRPSHKNKTLVFDFALRSGQPVSGTMAVSRWRAAPLPERFVELEPACEAREDVFDYVETPNEGVPEFAWHVNFADEELFGYYAGVAFAQDEIQVCEHPALASLRERLRNAPPAGITPFTREHGQPTPLLVRGVERRCAIDTAPDAEAGRLYGIYGMLFGLSSEQHVRSALTRIDPPTRSNLIAIEAPRPLSGRYARATIVDVLVTAYTGFRAAVVESRRHVDSLAEVVVHTGNWGCGAFGGNAVLMHAVQLFAARLAGVSRIVFHTFDANNSRAFVEARRFLDRTIAEHRDAPEVERIIAALDRRGFTWGVSDGN